MTRHARKKYDPEASDTEIRIGQTMPYSGPLSSYSTIAKAEAAYFKKINDEGGINGRKIRLISPDDGYSPPKTVEMVRRLVEQDEVLFLFQTLGTPSNLAVQKYLNAKKVPQLFVATGATRWNDPKGFSWTMGWQPSYQTEARNDAQHVLQARPKAKIAVLYQNDDYGKDYLRGFEDGLGSRANTIVAAASYEVTDPTVDSQVVQLQSSGADVWFIIATSKFAAQATDPQWQGDPALQEWLTFMKKYDPDGSTAESYNVYGYAVAQTLVQVLRQCGDNLTRENVMRQAASPKDLQIGFASRREAQHQRDRLRAVEQMQMMWFDGRQWVRFGDVMRP
jgi:branched-chain amino acid transport system substrate-binding protein